jgi:lipopolysaccharide export LptBFGC system permease protein LptF
MKILDKYIAKNFIFSYVISASVLLGLCFLSDLFVNLDEFIENRGLGIGTVFLNIATYYGAHCMLWFRDLAGFITVIASVFSLSRMTYNNELIAIMASGVSLKRTILPIIFLSAASMSLIVINQELIIPRLAFTLTREHDYTKEKGLDLLNIWFMSDNEGRMLISTTRFKDDVMYSPSFISREPVPDSLRFDVVDIVVADSATYNPNQKGWDLVNGRHLQMDQEPERFAGKRDQNKVDFIASTLIPEDIPLKQQEGYKSLLSSAQLNKLAHQEKRVKDTAELYLYKHARVTDPIFNMVMLLIGLPLVVSRDPRYLKTSIMRCFTVTTCCFLVGFICKIFATEEIFGQIVPHIWVWAPIIIFMPIAIIELDAMKT